MESTYIVIDTGSAFTKAGFAGEDKPRVVIDTIVGEPRTEGGTDPSNMVFGDKALAQKGILNLHFPIEHGVINDWGRLEHYWRNVFSDGLRLAPEEHRICLTESPLQSDADREKIAQVMFETFNFQGLYLANSAVVSLFACGRQSGLACESGATVTHVVPVNEGVAITPAIQRMELGGRDIGKLMVKLLTEAGNEFQGDYRAQGTEIKETLCLVAQDYEAALVDGSERAYETPCGTYMTVGKERYMGGEALFRPSLCGSENDSIQDMIVKSIEGCDEGLRADLYKSIALSGGNTLFQGIRERLMKELEARAGGATVKVEARDERLVLPFIGASLLASLSTMDMYSISREEYQENGPSILQSKGFKPPQ